MSTSRSRWRKTRNKDTPGMIGRFFELLARRIARAHLSKEGNEDLVMPQIGTGIEVKGSNFNNPFRITADQFERHAEHTGGFPGFEYFLYFFFCYRQNESQQKVGRPRRSLIASCKDCFDVYSVLAQRTDTVFIFDHRIIERVKERQGVTRGKFPNGEQEVILLGRRYLRTFNEPNAKFALSELGLEFREWIIRERPVKVDFTIGLFKHVLDLKVVEVLPSDFVADFSAVARVPRRPVPSRRTICIDMPGALRSREKIAV